jgi:DNA-binding transcriptional LysR family regulator
MTVAASLTPSVALIPPILRRFSERYPRRSIKLRTVPSETVVHEVAHAGAAIGIAGEVRSTEAVERQQILMDELIGIAPGGLFTSNGGLVSRGQARFRARDSSSSRDLCPRRLAPRSGE